MCTFLSNVLESNLVQIKKNLFVEMEPVRILDSQIEQFYYRNINLVKMIWSLISSDSTRETEEKIKE